MDINTVSEIIERLTRENGQIAGARLGQSLRNVLPDWNPERFGVNSLRAFIAAYVKNVVICGRAGFDVVYTLATAIENKKAETVLYWKTWVSPYSNYKLIADQASGEITLSPRAQVVPSTHLVIESTSVEDHKEIARSFLTAQHLMSNIELAALIESQSRNWWATWDAKLRKLEKSAEWLPFRQSALEEKLSEKISACGAREELRKPIYETIVGSMPGAGIAPTQKTDLDALRSIVIEAIKKMDEAQIRNLPIPIGLIVHTIEKK